VKSEGMSCEIQKQTKAHERSVVIRANAIII